MLIMFLFLSVLRDGTAEADDCGVVGLVVGLGVSRLNRQCRVAVRGSYRE